MDTPNSNPTPALQQPPKPKAIKVPNTPKSQAASATTRRYMQIAGVIIVLVVLVGGYAIYYLVGKYTHMSNVNKAQDQLFTSLQTKQKNLKELKPNYDAINTKGENGVSDADLILRAMPVTEDYENLVASLEKMGIESGVKVSSISQSSTSASTTTNTTPNTGTGALVGTNNIEATPFTFTVSVEGSYSAILEFLKKTENSARVINFNSMSLNGKTGNITANLTMTTFFKPEANIESTEVPLK